MLDEFGPLQIDPGTLGMDIKAHPHAGVAPTTYLLSGSGRHTDSLQNDLIYREGQFMVFSSGRGAIHEEVSSMEIRRDGGVVHGFPDLAQSAGFRKIRHANHDPSRPDRLPRHRDGRLPHQGADGRGLWPDRSHGDPQPGLLPPHPHRRGRPAGPAGRSGPQRLRARRGTAASRSRGVANWRPSSWPCTTAGATTCGSIRSEARSASFSADSRWTSPSCPTVRS